jgi:hypothetical protein
MKDQFNDNTERRRPPPYLTGHKVYEIVNDVHVVLIKRIITGKNTEKDRTCGRSNQFFGRYRIEKT